MALTLHNRPVPTEERAEQGAWPLWPLHTLLCVLFLGPIISPLFRATGLPLISDAGLLARDLLSSYICPTPAKSYLLLELPMAVCARCWGATIGLWIARALFTSETKDEGRKTEANHIFTLRPSSFVLFPWPLRLLLCALPFLLWPLEIIGESRGWWYAPFWLLLLNGAQAGFAAGLFFCSVWPGLHFKLDDQSRTATTMDAAA